MLHNNKLIGILGGTFDPIHLGHLHLANEVWRQLQLSKVLLIPCHQSPLRGTPLATDEHRLAMLRLATAATPHLCISDLEIQRKDLSYAVTTLQQLRTSAQCQNSNLCLIMGTDAFAKFTDWYQWNTILNMAHIIVADRRTTDNALQNNALLRSLLAHRQVHDRAELISNDAGKILLLNINPLPISATQIRSFFKDNQPIAAKKFLPETVWQYILGHNLYK